MDRTDAIKLLAIDDTPDNLTTLRAAVRDALPQTTVLTATSGPAGLDLAAAEDPDLILLDIVLPGMDGCEVCRRLKADERLKDIPVVFVTAVKTDAASRVMALEAGAEGFLATPLEPAELTAQIRVMVKVKAANRNLRMEKDALEALVAERTQALHQSEQSLKVSEAQIRAITDSAQDAIIMMDSQGLITFWNPAAEKILGYSLAEALGQNLHALLAPERFHAAYWAAYPGFKATGAGAAIGKTLELAARRKDGSEIAIALSLSSVSLKGEWHAVGIIRDITELEQLETERQKLFLLAESSSEFIAMCDLEMNPLYVNPAGRRMVGLPDMAAACRIKVPDYYFPEDQAFIRDEFFPRVLREGQADVEIRLRHFQTGEPIWMFYYLFVVRDSSGRAIGWATVSRDITERKRAEETLRKSESLFKKVFEILPIGLWIADQSGKLVQGNPAGVRIWGMEPKVGQSEYGVFKARRLPSREEIAPDDWALAHTVNKGVTIVDELLEIDAFDGTKKIILNYTAPILNSNGEVEGAIVVNQDITDHKQAEAEKDKLQAQLAQAQKMESVGRLAGGVAHDFNNMLGVILGYTQLAQERIGPHAPLQAELDEIRKAAQRSADLTRQLLAFARKQIVAPKVLDLNETVDGMLKMLRRLIGEDIALVWRPGRNPGPVFIDPSQVDQILANLCVNARDAIAGVGKVTIETDSVSFDAAYCAEHAGFEPGEFVMLAVSDDGCGMDAETQKRLFEPFFTTKELGRGTGLGLATVHGAVTQNHGFINVCSEPGRGTTVKIYLPRHAVKPASRSEQAPAPAAGGGTILLVEDEPAILKMTAMMLQSLGYAVIAAATPGEAIRLAWEHTGRIDLLMTDVVMPEMNGRDLAANLMSIYPDIKRLFMSGYTADVIAHHGVLDPGVQFLQKPFTRQDLAARIREALDRG